MLNGMNSILIILLGVCLLSVNSVLGQAENLMTAEGFKKIFGAQIKRSWQNKKLHYEKTVISDWGGEPKEEKRTFLLSNGRNSLNPQDSLYLEKETSLAIQFIFNEPRIKSYFSITPLDNNGIKAELKKEYFTKSELKAQTIVMENNVIRSITSKHSRSNPLYETQTYITVHFSEQGFYQKHTIEFWTHIPFLGTKFKTKISGQVFTFQESGRKNLKQPFYNK
jgi:hypothetical protein